MASSVDKLWISSRSGIDCPFCGDRPAENAAWSKVTKLGISTLYLHKIQTYRGYAVLVFDPRHATRISDLSPEEWSTLSSDIYVSQRAIERATSPDHVNVASLGNVVSHLHWHIVPRYIDDSRWGAPIWTTIESEMEVIRLSDEEHRQLLDTIRAKLKVNA